MGWFCYCSKIMKICGLWSCTQLKKIDALMWGYNGSMALALDSRNSKVLASVEYKPYFRQNDFVLYHGDSALLLAQLPANSIDMIFADPPYNLSNGGFSV